MNDPRLFLFDCDQALWVWEGESDWLSRVDSELDMQGPDSLRRRVDGKVLSLRKGARQALNVATMRGWVGIVSDNKPGPVKSALELLGLWSVVEPEAVNVRLWKGDCPKQVMVEEILSKNKLIGVPRDGVYWFDDQDYAQQAEKIGVNFVKINPGDDLNEVVSCLI